MERKSVVVLDVEEATGRPRLVAVLPVASNPQIGLFASGNPISNSDPTGLEVRVYSSPAFGMRLIGNHAWVWSSEGEGQGWGRMAKSTGLRPPSGDGIGDPNKDPYFVVQDLNGMSEKQFIEAIRTSPKMDSGPWCPPFNDCHSDLADTFQSLGVAFPGVPGGRHDWIGESSSQYQVTHQRPTATAQAAPSLSIPQPTFGVHVQQPSVQKRK